jgi:hypothetical protein
MHLAQSPRPRDLPFLGCRGGRFPDRWLPDRRLSRCRSALLRPETVRLLDTLSIYTSDEIITAITMRVQVVGPIDGDSVRVKRNDNTMFIVRVGGVDVPSSGWQARAAKKHILSWVGRVCTFRETCCGRPHGEVPGILIDSNGNNLGMELLRFGRRLSQFPISEVTYTLPDLSKLYA